MNEIRLKIRNSINNNLNSINKYMSKLHGDEIGILFSKIDHVLKFYDMTRKEITDILSGGEVPETFSPNMLSDLEGITNAMLFQLKYKVSSYTKEKAGAKTDVPDKKKL